MKKIKIAIIFLVLLVIGFFVYKNFISSSTKKVESANVARGNLEEKLTISGKVDADEHATLQFQLGGKLTGIGVKEGDYVKKYQWIASIDQRQTQKTLDKYMNTYLKTRWTFDQTKDDYKNSIISDSIKRIIDKAQFDLNNAVLDVEIQSLSLELSSLYTPIEGLVVRVDNPYVGSNFYLPTQAQFEVVNPKTMYVSVSADQLDVVKLHKEMQGTLVLDSYPDENLLGEISNISFIPKTGETGTVYEVKFTFNSDSSDYKYKMGMTGDVTFTVNKRNNVLYIPSKFIKTENDNKYVNTQNNGKKVKTTVKTGMETDTDTEILSGLSEGETVYD